MSSGYQHKRGGGASGAPTDGDYLVGTANAGLSAEIVVGTTPGGELGGTWASPTVDATHSGSAHLALATNAIVLGTAAGAGVATTTLRSDDTIAAFDPAAPTTIAYGDLVSAGSVAKAARRDHRHGGPTLGTASDTAAAGNDARLSDSRTPLTHTMASHSDEGALSTKNTVATADIDNDAVTYAKLQNVSATARLLGRITAAAGDAEELTGTQATTLLDLFTSLLKGLVPASGGGTTTFLRADGAFAAPTAAAADPSYSPGSFTVATETGRYIPKRMKLTTTQRATVQGTGRLRLTN